MIDSKDRDLKKKLVQGLILVWDNTIKYSSIYCILGT